MEGNKTPMAVDAPVNPYPYKATRQFPYGRDRRYVNENAKSIYRLGLGDLRANIHQGAAQVIERLQEAPGSQEPTKIMQSMLGGSAPKWTWGRGASVYNSPTETVRLNPSDYAKFGMALPLHEAIHGFQTSSQQAPVQAANEQRYGQDVHRLSQELAPAIAGVAATAQTKLPLRADEIRWDMGNYHPNVEYLRSQAEKYGVFDGQSVDRLIAENPQFLQMLARQDAPDTPPELTPSDSRIARRDSIGIEPIPVSHEMSSLRPNQYPIRPQTHTANQYGMLPRSQPPGPVPVNSRPLAPQVPQQPSPSDRPAIPSTPPQLAARGSQMMPGYQPQTPWAGNAAYGNVNPPSTEYGPNQSTPQVRDRVANRYDPTSWANMTRTPGEINQQVGERTQTHLAGLRQSGFDPYGARQQYQYSPLTNTGPQLPTPEEVQARRQQEIANYREQGLARDARMANDPTAQARFRAMNGPDAKFDPGQYRNQLGQATTAYNTYARAARMNGQAPMSYDTFLAQYSSGHLSPEVQGMYQQGRQLNQQIASERAQRKHVGPSLQFAQYMNQRYGMPMALPNDPQQAAQWQNSLAMQGNPYAMQSNLMNQQQMAAMGLAGMNNAAQMQQTIAQQNGLNYRAGLQQQTPLDPTQRAQVMNQWGVNDPQIRREQAERKYMADMQAQWASGTEEDRRRIQAEAKQRGDEAARIAESTRGMLSQNFPSVVGGYGLPAPQAPSAMPPAGSQTITNAPPSSTAVPPQASQPSPSNPAGLDPGKNISTPAPSNATSDDMFNAYSSLRAFYGREPTIDEVKKHLKEQGKAIPQHPENSGEVTPYYNYSRNQAQGQQDSPYASSYRAWLNSNKHNLGVAPDDPHSQYAPGNFSGF